MQEGGLPPPGNQRDNPKVAWWCVYTCRTGLRAHKHGSLLFTSAEVWAETTDTGGAGLGDGGGSQDFLSCPAFGEDNDPLSSGHNVRAGVRRHAQHAAMQVDRYAEYKVISLWVCVGVCAGLCARVPSS